jgi:hypothetical protein
VSVDRAVNPDASQSAAKLSIGEFTAKAVGAIRRAWDKTDIVPGDMSRCAQVKAPQHIEATSCFTPITRAVSSWLVAAWHRTFGRLERTPTWTMPEGSTLSDLRMPKSDRHRVLVAQPGNEGTVFQWKRNPTTSGEACAKYSLWRMAHEELVYTSRVFEDDVAAVILDLNSSITPKNVDDVKTGLRAAHAVAAKVIANRLLEPAGSTTPRVDKTTGMEPHPLDRLLDNVATDHFVAHMPVHVRFATHDICKRLASHLEHLKGAEWVRVQKFLEADVQAAGSWHALKSWLREPPNDGEDCVDQMQLATQILDVLWSSETVDDGPAGWIQRLQKFISLSMETDRSPVDVESVFIGAIVAFEHTESSRNPETGHRIDHDRLALAIRNTAVRDQWVQSLNFARSHPTKTA